MVNSVEKAFRVLAVFDKGYSTLTLSQVAQRAGLDLSATQRFTHTLTALGYLIKDPATRQFELSVKTLELGYHYMRGSRLVDRAMPVLQHLSKETEETINLTILDGTEIVFVARFLSRHVLNSDVYTGMRLPAFCIAPGRAIMSRMSEAQVRGILDRSDLRRYTPATEVEPEQILTKIAAARELGYATAFEELYHGDCSIAAPIIGASGVVVGAVNVAGSLSRFAKEVMIERYSPLVVAAGRAISQG
jgi:DNA-binding IclR family transcriptional regulator